MGGHLTGACAFTHERRVAAWSREISNQQVYFNLVMNTLQTVKIKVMGAIVEL